MVQAAPGGMEPALKPTLVPPFAPPVRVAAPPPVHATLPAAALARPAGYASLIATAVRLAGFDAGLVTTIVMVEVPLAGIEAGAKPLVTVGEAKTLSVALAASPVPALAVATGPLELAKTPGAGAVTVTVTVHVAPAGIEPPESVTLLPPLAADTTPTQPAPAKLAFGVAAFARPAG